MLEHARTNRPKPLRIKLPQVEHECGTDVNRRAFAADREPAENGQERHEYLPDQDPELEQPRTRVAWRMQHGNHLWNAAPSAPSKNLRVSQTVTAPISGVTISGNHACSAT